tara:strand:+ start:387 stop:1010 length:624 start_codon:yes stop_codon:yes gene_type:complete
MNRKTNKKKERDSKHYNLVYENSEIYCKEPEDIPMYYPMWKFARDIVGKAGCSNIVDLGCGPGHFAKVLINGGLFDETIRKYYGYDFSSVSIDMAKNIVGNHKACLFEERNLLEFEFSKEKPKDTMYVSFEFFEHICKDLSVIKKIPYKSNICFSVPSFDSYGHVRFFKNKNEIIERYSSLINIKYIKEFIQDNKSHVIYLVEGIRA